MRQCIDIPKTRNRLRRVEGQIRGITAMVEKDIPCDQILIQIGAAKAALHKIGQSILEGHLQHCVIEGIEHGNAEKIVKDLTNAIEQFSRIA